MKSLWVALIAACSSISAVAETAPAPAATAVMASVAPQELIQVSARKVLNELDANRALYRKDPSKLDALVGDVLLPNFDAEYAARLVLGQTWRSATPEQRKRFIDAFYRSMLRNYGASLLDFTADRLVVLPFRGDPAGSAATVRTEVKRSNGQKVPVNYSFRKTESGWKAWDVVIEGISYVKSFRTDIGSEVQQRGLQAVIERLESDAKAPRKNS
jgi:phospholipid transport system substrate-binding protein